MRAFEVFLVFLRLGLTSFGGPIAHLSYFHHEFVLKKKWLSDGAYGDLVALCQFLPGPASSQVGMAIGHHRAGVFGAILAWVGFTLPSALILVLFGLGLAHFDVSAGQHWLHGLKVVAVPVVAQAVWGMGRKLCPDWERIIIAALACAAVLFAQSPLAQVIVLVVAGIIGRLFLKASGNPSISDVQGKRGGPFLLLFLALLLLLPLLRVLTPSHAIDLMDSFYRSGALVFGGGHVVLPLLEAEVVPTGRVTHDLFMAGYGLANAIPGPLFAFGAYLGVISDGLPGALIGLVFSFLPAFLLILGALPYWEKLKGLAPVRQAMFGINAAVVGLLLAALYHPVWTSAIFTVVDFAQALCGLLLLQFLKAPSWAVVLLSVCSSVLLGCL